jgi:glycine/D-amino acid oxidase-like deaminating enzyme
MTAPAESAPMLKLQSYWLDTAPTFAGADAPIPDRADVVVVGGGFTGLSAARTLARKGAAVVVLEARGIAGEASGVNGGHCNNGLSHSYTDMAERIGADRARAFYRAFDAAVDTVERIVTDERIACEFVRAGKLKLAARPAHYESLARGFERLHREVDPDTELVPPSRVRDEIDSDRFFGGLLMKKSAQMHMGKFAVGLAEAAARHGARIHQFMPVTRLERRTGQAFRVHTPRGAIEARQVLIATGVSRRGPFSYFRRRIVPVGSFIVATEPLPPALAKRLMPNRRNYTTTKNINNYFRLTADDRLIFGGRARFAQSDPQSDLKSGRILEATMADLFPDLRGIRLDYCWGGLVDMTRDRLPRAGERDGLYYSMGYSGHGAQMSVHMGHLMAEVMGGDATANPWRELDWPAIPGYFGWPWFLPLVGAYYRLKDKLQ